MPRRFPKKPSQKAFVLGLGAFGLAAALATSTFVGDTPTASAAVARQPDDDEVLARVDPRDRAGARAAKQLAAGDVRARVELARRWLEAARASADPRKLGRAQAALAQWAGRDEVPDEVRLTRAQIAQALHDFAGARRDLDALAVTRPHDAAVQLGRAAIATVMADYPAALRSCAELAPAVSPLVASACRAPVRLVRGDAAAAYRELGELLDDETAPRVEAWALGLRGELAASLGEFAAAEEHLRASLALHAEPYTRVALADVLLAQGRPAEVLAQSQGGDDEGDGMLLRVAIAQKRLGARQAADTAAILRERLAATAARGDTTHQREQALFELDVEGRAEAALTYALGNWSLQKELIDALLVVRAAAAAGRPQAADPVRQWARTHGVSDFALTRALAAL